MFGLYADPQPVRADYWRDVAPVVPVASRSRQRPLTGWRPQYTVFGDFADAVQARELWRMHAAPDLYEEWMVDLAMDLHTQMVINLGKVSWFCDTCCTTVIADTEDFQCHVR